MSNKVEKWQAKDGSLHNSEQEATAHDRDVVFQEEISSFVKKNIHLDYYTMISEFISDHDEEIFSILNKKFGGKEKKKFFIKFGCE